MIVKIPRNPFGGVDEQALTDMVEAACGGVDRAFRLVRIWQGCYPGVRVPWLGQVPTREQTFRRRAKGQGYSDRAIELFLRQF